jgi:predicted nucleic acid-binding protein
VLAEVGNFLCATRGRRRFAPLVREVQADARFKIHFLDEAFFEDAVSFYARRTDKKWAFTDCASILLMMRLGVSDALTNDHHFRQAGFKTLLG